MAGLYILDGHKAIPCSDPNSWAIFFNKHERIVAKDSFDGKTVSTVFLGLDHNFYGGDPILFETMIFGEDDSEDFCARYSTWEEAEVGHNDACIVAFGNQAESVAKRLEWKDNIIFDHIAEKLLEGEV